MVDLAVRASIGRRTQGDGRHFIACVSILFEVAVIAVEFGK